jgi:hypothetical protein
VKLSKIYSRIHELEIIAGLPETADYFTEELEALLQEVEVLNMSTHRQKLSERLRALRERQGAFVMGMRATDPPGAV